MLNGCCGQSVRLWLSFLGCGQLSVRSRSCEPCYLLLGQPKARGTGLTFAQVGRDVNQMHLR
jgi:hypothetical protein